MNRLSLLIAFCLFPASAAYSQKTPEEALKTFTVADGLQIELFASEPMFVNPTCIDVDHKGRVWVCESVNYRTQLRKKPLNRKEGDRIVVLEDADADGKADKATTFYQAEDFIAPLGIAIAPQVSRDPKGAETLKVYVCHSPHIYVFEDEDGDLKADDKPKVLLTGFKGYDHDHGVHGIHFGPDGKLYFSVGDQGVDGIKDRFGKVWKSNNTDCRAGTIWRCNSDGSNLELLAHNFRNQYEPAVNSFGTMFVSDNDDDGNQQTRICYVMYGGNYGYHPRGKGESHWHEEQPGVVHKVLRTGFGSPTGMCWYEGTLLPKKYQGQLLHTEAGPRHVRCYHLKPKGAGYEAEQEVIATSSDNWFRPSDVCVAPDGSIIVSDWYDPGVGGHGMGDTTRGRIYRITPKGNKGYKVPELDLGTNKAISTALGSPNLARCYLAQQRIRQMIPNVPNVVEESRGEPNLILISTRYSWITSQTPAFEDVLKLPAVNAPLKKEFEEQGVCVLRFIKDRYHELSKAPRSARNVAIEYAGSGFPSVEREFLLMLRHDDPTYAKDLIWEAARSFDGQDHFYLAAIGIAVGTDAKRREVILADFEKHFPEWNDKVAKLVWELRPPQVIAKLDQKLTDPKLTAAQKAQVLDILAVSQGTEAGIAVLKLLAGDPPPELRAQALKSLKTHLPTKWSALKKSAELDAAVEKLLGDEQTVIQGLELVGAAELTGLTNIIAKGPLQPSRKKEVRVAAVRALASFKNDTAAGLLGAYLSDESIRKQLIQALGTMGIKSALEPLQKVLTDDKLALDVRQDSVAALAASREGSIWLLEAHERKELPEALLPEVARVMRNSPYQDLRNKALIAFPAPGKLDPKKLPPIAKLASRKGDAEHGRQLLLTNKDLGCLRCHIVRGHGGQIGPDLSMIGKKASRENLFESLLDPDKAVADQFIQWMVETKKGLLIKGLLIEETPDHLILRDALGKDSKLFKKELDQQKKISQSIMPSDLVAFMTEQDLVDVVEYLATLKTPALTMDSWFVEGPFPKSDLDTVHQPEEMPGVKHPRRRWETIRPGGDGYVDLRERAGKEAPGSISYLFREFESPADQEAAILLGTDDGVKLWVNGKLVHTNKTTRAAQPEQDTIKVNLKKGANAVFLKINNGDGPHGFYFTVLSEQELKLK